MGLFRPDDGRVDVIRFPPKSRADLAQKPRMYMRGSDRLTALNLAGNRMTGCTCGASFAFATVIARRRKRLPRDSANGASPSAG